MLKRELEPKTTGARVYNLTTRETMRRNRRKIKKIRRRNRRKIKNKCKKESLNPRPREQRPTTLPIGKQ